MGCKKCGSREIHTNLNGLCDRCSLGEDLIANNTASKPKPESTPIGGLKYDGGKLQYSLIPPVATKALAEVLTFGANKYAPNSWQTVEEGERRYLDAAMRHLEAWRDGESTDDESGYSHLKHCLTNIAFLLHFEQERLNETK